MPVSPYQDLYIYYLSGRLPHCESPGPNFLGNWQEEDTSFLFFSSPAQVQVETLVNKHPGLVLEDAYQMTYAEWQGGHTGPLTVGRFRMIPPWMASPPNGTLGTPSNDNPHYDNISDIIFDPGVVFGNGLHPTTRDCLAALETVWKKATIGTVLDLGSGTGILTLAAARLGARHVLAVDNNLLAVQTTRSNVQLNGLEARILAVQGDAEAFVFHSAELLIANLHYAVMKRLVATSGFRLKPWAILSGLLSSEAGHVSRELKRQGATILSSQVSEGKWHTFLVSRVDAGKEGT